MPEVKKQRRPGRPPLRDERFSRSKLATAMLDAGLRVEGVAYLSDVSYRTIQKYLGGQACPSPEMIGRMAEALEIDPDDLRDMPKVAKRRAGVRLFESCELALMSA